MRELHFTAVGVAQTKGSARAYTVRRYRQNGTAYMGARVDNDNPKAKGWAGVLAYCAAVELARSEYRGQVFAGPVVLNVVFYLPRPKKFQAKKYADVCVPHVTKPDVDKLVRCAKDALTKVVWTDDAQVVELHASKRYVEAGEFPRAEIIVRSKG